MAATTTTAVEDEMAQDLAELTASALGRPYEGRKHCEHGAKIDENGVEYGSSLPPSPPSTGTNTPTLSIAPTPDRLRSLVPPPQYGVVEDYTIFRSSYPQDRNMSFIKSLEIKSILTLVETDPTPGYTQWLDEHAIKQGKVTIAPNKEAKEGKKTSATSLDSICEALLFLMDGANHPLWIHCNQGRHRTGCVVACYRKIQGMPIEQILEEYVAYASPKARPGDIALIKSFDPNALFKYAQDCGFIGGLDPKYKHAGPASITDVYELAYELARGGRQDSVTPSESQQAVDNISSTMSDVSLGEQTVTDSENTMSRVQSNAMPTQAGEQTSTVDSRLLSNGGDSQEVRMGVEVVEVVEVSDDGMDGVEEIGLARRAGSDAGP